MTTGGRTELGVDLDELRLLGLVLSRTGTPHRVCRSTSIRANPGNVAIRRNSLLSTSTATRCLTTSPRCPQR